MTASYAPTIVSSVLDADATAQKDGRFYVRELHTDSLGKHYRFEYLAAPGVDKSAVMAARAATIIPGVQQAEMLAAINDGSTLASLAYNTLASALEYVGSQYGGGVEQETLARGAQWVLARISAGELTDAQVQTALGMDSATYTAFKGQMQTLVADWQVVLAARV